jgi:hypothetical protein
MRALNWSSALLLLAACATTSGATQMKASVGEEFRVRAGQTAQVEDLRVRFVRVTEDSRCPINARCIRAGSAKIEVELRAPRTAAQRAVLTTPDEPRGATYGPYEIEVLELQPGREIEAPAPRFEAVLRVRRR